MFITSKDELLNVKNKEQIIEIEIHDDIGEDLSLINGFSNLTKLFLSGTHITSLNGMGDFPHLTTLNLARTQIKSLEGMGQLPKLTKLDLSETHITSLKGIENLTNLTNLDLTLTHITSLKGIENLTNLTTLNLTRTRIKSLEGMGHLPKLAKLDLSGTQITSLKGMGDLPHLTTLFLAESIIASLEGMGNLPKLATLTLSGTMIKNLKGMPKLPNLHSLNLSNSKITSLDDMPDLPKLGELYLSDTKISSLEGISNLQNLTILNLNGTEIKYMDRFSSMRELKTLMLGYSKIENLNNMPDLPKLEYLYLRNTKIHSLEGMPNLNNLATLYLSDTEITSLRDMPHLPNLYSLNLSNSKLTSLEGMGYLPKLAKLDLSGTHITSLEGMCDLPNLTSLNLAKTQITSLAGMGNLDNLYELDLSETPIKSLAGIDNLHNLLYLVLNASEVSSLNDIEPLDNLRLIDLSNTTIDKIPFTLIQNSVFLDSGEKLPNYIQRERSFFIYELEFRNIQLTEERYIVLSNTVLRKQPVSLFFQSSDLIRSYYESAKIVPHETKVLFLGFGGAGKTHTIKRMLNGDDNYEDSTLTKGIDIYQYESNDGDKLNIWDFGGQDILHSMHRCFLSDNCCYVIVVGNRQENSYPDLMRQARYWLNNIRSYAKNSPILLALNCWEGLLSDGLDTRVLREEFPELNMDYISYQAKGTNETLSFDNFEKALYKAVKTSPGYDLEFPKSWHAIMSHMMIMDDYVSLTSYLNVCKGVLESEGEQYDEEICLWLLKWFDELGVCFSYYNREEQKERQEEYKVFKPAWLTKAVYKIIDYKNRKEKYQNGIIPFDSIQRCLTSEVKGHEVGYILKLMEKFQLATAIDPTDQESDYFIPALCFEVESGDFRQSIQDIPLRSELLIQYGFIPEYIVQQLMLRLYKKIQKLPYKHYARGFIYKTDTGAYMLVCATDYENQPSIIVETYCNEENKTYDFTKIIIKTIEEINSDIKVSSPIYFIKRKEGHTAKFSTGAIAMAIEKRQKTMWYPGKTSYVEYDLKELLDDFTLAIQEPENKDPRDPKNIIINVAKNQVIYNNSEHIGSTIIGDGSTSNESYNITQEEL